jgi:hypothetical protein
MNKHLFDMEYSTQVKRMVFLLTKKGGQYVRRK